MGTGRTGKTATGVLLQIWGWHWGTRFGGNRGRRKTVQFTWISLLTCIDLAMMWWTPIIQLPLWHVDLESFGEMHRVIQLGHILDMFLVFWGPSILISIVSGLICFHINIVIRHFVYILISTYHFLLMIAIVTEVRSRLSVVLICISLMQIKVCLLSILLHLLRTLRSFYQSMYWMGCLKSYNQNINFLSGAQLAKFFSHF